MCLARIVCWRTLTHQLCPVLFPVDIVFWCRVGMHSACWQHPCGVGKARQVQPRLVQAADRRLVPAQP
jgi:hypothetical protein